MQPPRRDWWEDRLQSLCWARNSGRDLVGAVFLAAERNLERREAQRKRAGQSQGTGRSLWPTLTAGAPCPSSSWALCVPPVDAVARWGCRGRGPRVARAPGTWTPGSTCSAACLYPLLLKEKETLTLAFFIPQELKVACEHQASHRSKAAGVQPSWYRVGADVFKAAQFLKPSFEPLGSSSRRHSWRALPLPGREHCCPKGLLLPGTGFLGCPDRPLHHHPGLGGQGAPGFLRISLSANILSAQIPNPVLGRTVTACCACCVFLTAGWELGDAGKSHGDE